MPETTVTISKRRYQELIDASLKLAALEGAGVDNWEGYDIAMETLKQTIDDDDASHH